MRQPRDGRRQRLADGRDVLVDPALLELVEQVEDPGPALERVVELEVELRDPLQPEPLAELVTDERHLPAHRGQRRLPLLGLADHADRHPGVAQVRRRLDVGDRGEPDPRVVDLAAEDLADLLPQQLVDSIRSLRHRSPPVSGRRRLRPTPLG